MNIIEFAIIEKLQREIRGLEKFLLANAEYEKYPRYKAAGDQTRQDIAAKKVEIENLKYPKHPKSCGKSIAAIRQAGGLSFEKV